MFTGPKRTVDGLILTMDARNFKSHKRDYNILDYSTWTLGTGSAPGFGRNGSDIENHRILDTDPWGNEVIIWEARPEGNNSSDGGWNGSRFPIDNTKTYRFSTWMRRTVNTDPSSYYLGTNGYGSVNGVKLYNNETINTNPYFVAGSWNHPDSEWVLIVGHVHPHDYVGPKHIDSGQYKLNGDKTTNANDFRWLPETVESLHRSYAYYISDTTTRQQWCYPRVDLCDGTEPSINDLLNAKNKKWEDIYGKNKLDIIGAKWDPKGYLSFRGQGTRDGVIKGDRIEGFGSICDTSLYPEGVTLSWWQRITGTQPQGQSLFYGSGTISHIELKGEGTPTPTFRTEAKLQNGYSFGSGTIPGGSLVDRWVNFTIVFDHISSPRTVKWYHNGELFHTHANFDNGTGGVNEHFYFHSFGRATGTPDYLYSQSFKGDLAKMDFYGKPLSPQQINKNYHAFKNRFKN